MKACLAVLAMLVAGHAVSETSIIEAGSVWNISPSADTECFTNLSISGGGLRTDSGELECTPTAQSVRIEMEASSGAGTGRVVYTGTSRIVVAQFEIEEAEGADTPTYLPIHVRVPVEWNGRMFNATGWPSASVDANMWLRIRESREGDASYSGRLVAQSLFNGATHGGVGSCISIPTDKIAVRDMVIGCAAAAFAKTEGDAKVELLTLVRTGQVYNVEVAFRGVLSSTIEVPGPAYIPERLNFKTGAVGPERGLAWRGTAQIRVGTDAAQVVESVRAEIAELRELVDELRSDFDHHYHTYKTGRGLGHNKVQASTPPPYIPTD